MRPDDSTTAASSWEGESPAEASTESYHRARARESASQRSARTKPPSVSEGTAEACRDSCWKTAALCEPKLPRGSVGSTCSPAQGEKNGRHGLSRNADGSARRPPGSARRPPLGMLNRAGKTQHCKRQRSERGRRIGPRASRRASAIVGTAASTAEQAATSPGRSTAQRAAAAPGGGGTSGGCGPSSSAAGPARRGPGDDSGAGCESGEARGENGQVLEVAARALPRSFCPRSRRRGQLACE